MSPTAPLEIRTATADDRDAVLATILLAFATDPVARFAAPTPPGYLASMGMFSSVMCDAGLPGGSVYVAPGYTGAAIWHRPGAKIDEDAIVTGVASTVPEDRQEAMFGMFMGMAEHHPEEDHWYLAQIGVDPSAQGRGVGSSLMKHVLAQVDAEHLPAYLESSNPLNIPLYERFGFEIVGEIAVAEGVTMTPMLRAAR